MSLRTGLLALVAAVVLGSVPAAVAAPAPVETLTRTHTATWHHHHFHMNAYRRTGSSAHLSGRCHGTWHDDSGQCWGYGEWQGGSGYPFHNYVTWKWNRNETHCPTVPGGRDPQIWRQEVQLKAVHDGSGTGSVLCGWVDHGWNVMIVTGGHIVVNGHHYAIHATGGYGPDRGNQGGPLAVYLGDADSGYVLGLRGWLKY